MGDAKRHKLMCNKFRLEPNCTRQDIHIVGIPDEEKALIHSQLHEYWQTLDLIPYKRLKNLISTAKSNSDGLILQLPNEHTVIPSTEFTGDAAPTIECLPLSIRVEIKDLLAHYDPIKNVIIISFISPDLPRHITNLLAKYSDLLFIINYEYSYENIYN
jgi:hypothetical protein